MVECFLLLGVYYPFSPSPVAAHGHLALDVAQFDTRFSSMLNCLLLNAIIGSHICDAASAYEWIQVKFGRDNNIPTKRKPKYSKKNSDQSKRNLTLTMLPRYLVIMLNITRD